MIFQFRKVFDISSCIYFEVVPSLEGIADHETSNKSAMIIPETRSKSKSKASNSLKTYNSSAYNHHKSENSKGSIQTKHKKTENNPFSPFRSKSSSNSNSNYSYSNLRRKQ